MWQIEHVEVPGWASGQQPVEERDHAQQQQSSSTGCSRAVASGARRTQVGSLLLTTRRQH